MRSEVSILKIPDRKLTKLFTNKLAMSELEDVDMRVDFEITGRSASACIVLWKAEEILEASVIFIKFKIKSPQIILSQFSKCPEENASPRNVLNCSKLVLWGLYIDDTKKCLLENLILTVNVSIRGNLVFNWGIISQSKFSDTHTISPPPWLSDLLEQKVL